MTKLTDPGVLAATPEMQPEYAEDEISLLDLLLVLSKHMRHIFVGTVVFIFLSVGVALYLPDQFTAKTTIMPPQKGSSGAAALLAGQLGALGGGLSLGGGGTSDVMIGLLHSRQVVDVLLRRFQLVRQFHAKTWEEARKTFSSKLLATADKKTGFIEIAYTDKYPVQAAQIANAAVAVLNQVVSHLAITKASRKRLFFEQQVQQTQAKLNRDEVDLSGLGTHADWIDLYPQVGEVAVSNANIRAEITSHEVELSALRISETVNNPDYLRIERQLNSLREKLQSQPEQAAASGSPPKTSAQSTIYLQKYRDVVFQQEVLKLMQQQYESAKIDEAKDYPEVQVVDTALVPEHHSKPKRALIVVVGAFLGFFLMILWAFIHEAWLRSADDPETAEKIRLIRQYLWR